MAKQIKQKHENKPQRKNFKKRMMVLFFILIAALFTGHFLLHRTTPIPPDRTAYQIKPELNSKVELEKVIKEELPPIKEEIVEENEALSDNEILMASFSDISLIPNGEFLPDADPIQERPALSYLSYCISESERILKEKPHVLSGEEVQFFNYAYAKTPKTDYLNYAFNSFIDFSEQTTDSYLQTALLLNTQKESLCFLSSTLLFRVYEKMIVRATELASSQKPIEAVQAVLLINHLPKIKVRKQIIEKVKSILIAAFDNKNLNRDDGKFLELEESTQFSIYLIDLAWHYYRNKEMLSPWLYALAEKEACRLAFRLEQDGSLPVWDNKANRKNLAEIVFKAALAFDREDLKYLSYNGWWMTDSIAPKHKSFNFHEIDLLIYRTGWNHDRGFKWDLTPWYKGGHTPDALQITYHRSKSLLSISLGPFTQILCRTKHYFFANSSH